MADNDNDLKLDRIRDGSSGMCSMEDKGPLGLSQASTPVQAVPIRPNEGMQSGLSAWSGWLRENDYD